MKTKANKAEQTGERVAFRGVTARQSVTGEVSHAAPGIELQDARSVTAHQSTLQDSIDTSPRQAAQAKQLSAVFGSPEQREEEEEELQLVAAPPAAQYDAGEEETPPQGRFDTVQRQGTDEHGPPQGKLDSGQAVVQSQTGKGDGENRTGMPDRLKAGIERLSGVDLSDVRVQTNSPKPAQLNAHAYAQGNEIHLGPGQEKHLPHEAWHLVQQRQGRVRPTVQMAGVQFNDEEGLEREADLMGGRALQMRQADQAVSGPSAKAATASQPDEDWIPGGKGRLKFRYSAFGPGTYPPSGPAGMDLLRHELTHTLQARANVVLRRDEHGAPAAPRGSRSLYWRGITVSTDRSSIRQQLEGLVEKGGVGALRSWIQGFLAVDRKVLAAAARALGDADVDAIVTAVNETNLELEADAKTFVDGLAPSATAIANGILDASEERIERELEHYGIKETEMPPGEGGGGAKGGPSNYETRVTMVDTESGQNAQQLARELAEARRAADKAQREYNELVQVPGMSEIEKAIRREMPELKTRFRVAEDNWRTAEDRYAKQAMAATRKFPILTMYASGENIAARLGAFASQPVEQLGETIWRESRKRLENIETVRGELGGRFNPLFNQRILDLTLGNEDVKGWQKRVGRDHVAAAKEKAEDDKMLWTAIAIGLGLIAAIPTGGTSLAAAGLVTAAGVAGAALSVYNAYEHWREYQIQSAAAETDYAKAEALAKDEPSLLWLAIDIIGAGLELGAAAAAFRALSATVKAAKAGDVSAAINVAKVADSVGISGAAKTKIVGETVAGLSEEAIEQAARTMARSGGMTQQERIARLMSGLAEHTEFRGDLRKVIEMMEHVRGRIPDTARKMAAEGKVRVLNEASLIDEAAYGPVKGAKMWEKYAHADADVVAGFYDPTLDIIFMRSHGSTEDLAGVLIHEAMHRIGKAHPARGNDFMSEAIAEFAERDFYMTLYAEGGPLAGKAPKSERIQQFLSWSDEQLMHNIEVRYFAAKKHLSPMQRAKFRNFEKKSADEVVESIFDDIWKDYQARLVKE